MPDAGPSTRSVHLTDAVDPATRAVVPPPPASMVRPSGSVLDFGRYAGWSIGQLARHDPDYLRWLCRHSSGIRFRAEVEARLQGGDFMSLLQHLYGDEPSRWSDSLAGIDRLRRCPGVAAVV